MRVICVSTMTWKYTYWMEIFVFSHGMLYIPYDVFMTYVCTGGILTNRRIISSLTNARGIEFFFIDGSLKTMKIKRQSPWLFWLKAEQINCLLK